MCEDIAGGSDLSAGERFFHEIHRPFLWVPDVRWRNHYFARNKEAFPCVRPWTQLSASPRTVHFRWMSFIDHVDQAASRAPWRWTMARPRKGTSRRWEDAAVDARAERSTRVHWSGCGVRLPSPQSLASSGNSRGGEASAAAQPATGGRSRRHDQRCFGRLEQEGQRLKKHYGCWLDIIRSLEY